MFFDETPLEENQFYLLKRDEKFHLMLTSPLYEEGYQIYAYNNRLNLVIGNDNQCNITYPCEYLYELLVNIPVDNGQIQLSHNNKMYVYVNGEAIGSSNINLKRCIIYRRCIHKTIFRRKSFSLCFQHLSFYVKFNLIVYLSIRKNRNIFTFLSQINYRYFQGLF